MLLLKPTNTFGPEDEPDEQKRRKMNQMAAACLALFKADIALPGDIDIGAGVLTIGMPHIPRRPMVLMTKVTGQSSDNAERYSHTLVGLDDSNDARDTDDEFDADAEAGYLIDLNKYEGIPTSDRLVLCYPIERDDGKTVYVCDYSPPGLFPVNLTEDGGSAGNKTTQCSFTYTVKTTDDSTTLGTTLSPRSAPARSRQDGQRRWPGGFRLLQRRRRLHALERGRNTRRGRV